MKTSVFFASMALIVLIDGAFCPSRAQQSQERVIHRLPIEKNEPIEITAIKVNGQSISFDKKFTADDDWIRTLVISVKNTSLKRILFASIRLQFPRQDPKQRFSVFQIFNGNWALRERPPNQEERLAGIKSGETMEIGLSAQRFAGLRKFLTQTNYPSSIEKVELSIDIIIFEDDTAWFAGNLLQRDPNDAASWIISQYSHSNSP